MPDSVFPYAVLYSIDHVCGYGSIIGDGLSLKIDLWPVLR